MNKFLSRFDALQSRGGQQFLTALLVLGGLTALLLVAAVIGAFAVGDDEETLATGPTAGERQDADGDGEADGDDPTGVDGSSVSTLPDGSPDPNAPGGGDGGDAGPTGGDGGGGGDGQTAPAPGPGEAPSQPGATRVGVSAKAVKWGLHAPKTFDGAPLNLAEDPLEGVDIYIKALNAAGGIHGRKIEYRVEDDRYTVRGGKAAADALVNDYKPFHVSGTLGVDQIYQVATEAKKRGVPYMAGGGSESVFKDIGMFQTLGSYDTHLEKLADFLGKETKKKPGESIYAGRTKVGVSELDSPYIAPSVETFKRALERNGLQLVVRVKVRKPTEQTTYAQEISELKKADIVVPAQDPITTSRQVAECRAQACQFVWSFSNFAHESDVALDLMGGGWTGVRGLATGCYYLNAGKDPYQKIENCGMLNRAHEQWVQINGEDDWRKDGQGGLAGYQFVHFWTKALTDIGNDPTREKFVSALLNYDRYNNLIGSPITFKGSSNLSHGAEAFVVYEGGSDRKYKQLTPGFVSSF